MQELTLLQQIAVWALPVLLAITLHEVAHGRVALAFGDPTARAMGRLSLNPLRHVDPIGTVLVPLAMLLLPGGFIFGWARPVPVNFSRLRNPRRDMMLVALAGPGANLAMALGWALVWRIGLATAGHNPGIGLPMYYMGLAGVFINVLLAVLNLLPIPPLDGSRVLAGLLPARQAGLLMRLEPFGLVILLALLVTGVLGHVLIPAMRVVQAGIFFLVGGN